MDDTRRSLFIVELKREDLQLTDDDRDQGISYARLLDPMAPFVLVTNGRDANFFDTITKLELSNVEVKPRYGAWQNGTAVTDAKDLLLRQEALQHFISYSLENVQRFCDAQRAARMEPLRDAGAALEKKYVPDLYEPRRAVRAAFDLFFAGQDWVFALTGRSGRGKTNEMCALAERLGADLPVLFFAASHLAHPLLDAIADEFAWHFSEQLTFQRLCDRLAKLVQPHAPLVLVIDAIDDAPGAGMPQAVGELAARVAATNGRLRLVVSLKDGEWDRFARFADVPSALAEKCAKLQPPAIPAGGHELPDLHGDLAGLYAPSFILGPFTDTERDAALSKYQSVFRVAGLRDGPLRSVLADPFLLRIVAEAYSGGQAPPAGLLENVVLERFVGRTLRVLGDADRADGARVACVAVASEILKQSENTDASFEPSRSGADQGRDAVHVRAEDISKVGSGIVEGIRDAIRRGLLVEIHGAHGDRELRFQYDRVRDYFVETGVLRPQALTPEALRSKLPEWAEQPTARQALALYWPAARLEHRPVLAEFARVQVDRRLQAYERMRSTFGPVVRERIGPRTPGRIGAIFSLSLDGVWTYGYVTVPADGPRVFEVSSVPFGTLKFEPGVPYGLPKRMRGDRNFSLILGNPERAGREDALRDLRDLVMAGGLDRASSDVLALEVITAVVDRERQVLRLPRKPGTSPQAGELLADLIPVPIELLRRRVHAEFGSMMYEAAVVQEQMRVAMQVPSPGSASSVVINVDPAALEAAAQRGYAEAETGMRFPHARRNPSRAFPALDDALGVAARRRWVIRRTYLPPPDRGVHDARFDEFADAYTDAQLSLLVAACFDDFVREYARIARGNFGRLADHFVLYRSLPVVTTVQLFPRPASARGREVPATVSWGFSRCTGRRSRVEVSRAPSPSPFLFEAGIPTFSVRTKAGERPLLTGITQRRVEDLLRPARTFPLDWGFANPGTDRRAPIWALVLDQIAGDLQSLPPEIRDGVALGLVPYDEARRIATPRPAAALTDLGRRLIADAQAWVAKR